MSKELTSTLPKARPNLKNCAKPLTKHILIGTRNCGARAKKP